MLRPTRPFVLLLLIFCSIRSSAQLPETGHIEIVPATYVELRYIGSQLRANDFHITDDLVVEWALPNLEDTLFVQVCDINTGRISGSEKIVWDHDDHINAATVWNNTLIIFSSRLSRSKGERGLELYIRSFSLPSLDELIAPIQYGHLGYLGKDNRLGFSTAISKSGRMLAIIENNLQAKGRERILHHWVLDSGTGQMWSGVHAIPFVSDHLDPVPPQFLVDDEGAIHYGYRIQKNVSSELIETGKYEFIIHRFYKEARSQREFQPPDGKRFLSMGLADDHDGIAAVGFMAEARTPKVTTGVYKMHYPYDHIERGRLVHHQLPEPVPAVMFKMVHERGKDGTIHFSAIDHLALPMRVINEHMITCAIDSEGDLKYAVSLPGFLGDDMGFNYILADGAVGMLLTGMNDETLALSRRGEKYNKQPRDDFADHAVLVFSENAKPSFYRFAEDHGRGSTEPVISTDGNTVLFRRYIKATDEEKWIIWRR